jgi:hypothetical protein
MRFCPVWRPGDWSCLSVTTQCVYSERLNACRSILTEAQGLHTTGVRILFGIYRTDDNFRVLAVTFLPESDVHTHGIKKLMVPRSFLCRTQGRSGTAKPSAGILACSVVWLSRTVNDTLSYSVDLPAMRKGAESYCCFTSDKGR